MTTNIKLLQYNIFLRPPPVNSLGGEYKDKRLQHFIDDHLDQYDVLCLQECFETLSFRRQRLVKHAKRKGLTDHTSSKRGSIIKCNGTIKLIDGGLVILSRFPIVEKRFHPFTASCDVDSMARKGVLYARIALGRKDGRQLHVFTTHTQASYNFAASNASLDAKHSQIAEMGEFIREVTAGHPKEWPIVVTGDFNMDTLQNFCPEYETAQKVFEECRRFTQGDEQQSAYIDVLKEMNGGKVIATTTAFEWKHDSGLALRSSLLTKDANALQGAKDQHSSASGDATRKEQEKLSNSPDYVSDGTTFWADQCLDFVFAERHNGLGIKSAYVEQFLLKEGLPYKQISDHHGVCVELELK